MSTNKSLTARDEAAAHLEIFRLNDLPQELRNSIYEYALEPRVIFRHTSLTDIRPTYHLPNLDHHPQDIIYDTDWDVASEDSSEDDDPWGNKQARKYWFRRDPSSSPRRHDFNTAVLTFKVLVSAPLLAVSKATNEEVKSVLRLAKESWIQHYEELLRASIHLHRIRSPSAALIDLFSYSDLILEFSIPGSMFFLHNLPDSLKLCVRRLVIQRYFYIDWDQDSPMLWHEGVSGHKPFFIDWIWRNLPNLRTVAIEIPGMLEEYTNDMAIDASNHLCTMVQLGRLDVVQFFYKESREDAQTDYDFFKRVRLEGYTYTGKTYTESERFDQSLISGVEQPISPTSIGSELWRDLGARRVVKITRWQAHAGKERDYSELRRVLYCGNVDRN